MKRAWEAIIAFAIGCLLFELIYAQGWLAGVESFFSRRGYVFYPWCRWMGGVCGALGVLSVNGKKLNTTVSLVGYRYFKRMKLTWDRNSFCRGWLITGSTGSGKTESGINILMHQVFQNENGQEKETWASDSLNFQWKAIIEESKKEVHTVQSESMALEAEQERLTGILKALASDQLKSESACQKKPATYQMKALSERIEEMAQDRMTAGTKIICESQKRRHQLQKLIPYRYSHMPWGGLCVDEKGMYWEVLQKMAAHYQREHSLMLLKIKPEGVGDDWTPSVRFNLLSDDKIPSTTYADCICRTAQSLEGGGDNNPFFRTQASHNIAMAIELDRALCEAQKKGQIEVRHHVQPSLSRCYQWLTSRRYYEEELERLGLNQDTEFSGNVAGVVVMENILLKTERLRKVLRHFDDKYWAQPKDQLGGVQSTIANYLQAFTQDDIASVFCADSTFSLDELDLGLIICVALPQKYQLERRYVCTLLKMLFYQHVLRRFDRFSQQKHNLLICWQDEAQRFISESDGNVDLIRQASATTVMACQSKVSLYPPLGGKEKGQVTILNPVSYTHLTLPTNREV